MRNKNIKGTYDTSIEMKFNPQKMEMNPKLLMIWVYTN